ncbi:MAG: glycoside hydrolase family 3 C-terminal domain-containing protein [Flavobacteriales bacterium]|nr:glycoside hydrolase family 3 C-terminal domain-containing protein [Flavobacteriales bacterium]
MAFFCNFSPYIKKVFIIYFNLGVAFNSIAQAMDTIENIIEELSIEEKIAMCHAQSKFSSSGVPRLGIPELWMSDGPHGIRAEMNWDDWNYANWTNDYITAFPALTCLAATFNPSLSFEYGISIGEEARYRKKDILLGPGVNIYRTPLNGRNFEYMGEDPHLAAKMVVPYIKGVQQNGVASCVKHFALNNQEKWRGHINVEVSDRALHEIYLPAFKAAVTEGKTWAIMGAYNKFRGQHCCHNKILLQNILKDLWRFDGVVISDWAGTHSTNEAIHNGLDIEMGTPSDMNISKRYPYQNNFLGKPFLDKIISGEIDEQTLNDKVRRILKLMFRTSLNKTRPFGSINNSEHYKIAYNVASEGIVLLKNSESLLPLDKYKKIRIAVIGENAKKAMSVGGGSSELKTDKEISPLLGIKKEFNDAIIEYASGYSSKNENSIELKNEAISIVKDADVVLFIGGLNKNTFQDSEAEDRKQYELPYGQPKLIKEISKYNKNVAVILISGNAVKTDWKSDVKSIVQTWYLGSEAGNAIASILSGKINPSGKLPFSFPENLNDNGAHYYGEKSYPGKNGSQLYEEDILVGYRWHDTKNIKPSYGFGHGLSYTTFELLNIQTDKKSYTLNDIIKVTCEVKNTGGIEGKEVVQVYIGKKNSKVKRAKKELKGFKKVSVSSSQLIEVNININIKELAYYDEKSASWEIEKGNYIIYIGNGSRNISKEIEITII